MESVVEPLPALGGAVVGLGKSGGVPDTMTKLRTEVGGREAEARATVKGN